MAKSAKSVKAAKSASRKTSKPPNILVIWGDDIGTRT